MADRSDLAEILNPKATTRAANEAQVQRLVTQPELTTLVTRYPGRRTSQLTPEQGATPTRSPCETKPSPATKSTPSEQDRDRDADLLNAGFSALRITDQRLKQEQAREARRLKTILRSRSSSVAL